MAIKTYPGLIDAHVHLREPGATDKEDFYTGSRSAVAGGFTFVLDMPNNPLPTVSIARLQEKINLSKKAICDIGFFYGTDGQNIKSFKEAAKNPRVYGLKIFLNHTTGDLLVHDLAALEEIFKAWNSDKPIAVHAENIELAAAIDLANLYNRRLHVCHLSLAESVELVRKAKAKKYKITAGATPHHLFLTGEDRKKLGGYADMKPPLGSKKDQAVLWQALNDGTIDIVETDHAPHAKAEKERENPAFGVTGLETAVGLLFLAVKEKKIKESQIKKLLYDNPRRIFNIPIQLKTSVLINTDKKWIVGEAGYETKCGWSPFNGWEVYGKIEKVVLRGKILLEEGEIVL